jgi:hypothetical protein
MRITQIVQETTTSGSVATVAQPLLKGAVTRNPSIYGKQGKPGTMFKGKVTNKPFVNSISESAIKEEEISEQDLILVPGQGRRMKPGFISKAADRTDREVEMALGDLFQAAKNAKMTYDMLKDVGEDEGIEGWVQEKIIKASDYLNTIREYLENKRLQREGTMGALAGGVAGAYLGKSPSAAITGAEIGSELQDTFATEGSHKRYQPKHVAWVVRHGDGKVSEFKPHEDDAARAQFERVKGNRGASIYAIDQHSQSIPMGSLKAMRKKQDVAEGGRTMSRAAKGYEKYGKEGMQALAKAGREGKDLDKVRDKYNKYDEGVTEDSDTKLPDLSKIRTHKLEELLALQSEIGRRDPRTKASAELIRAELKKRGVMTAEGANVDRMVRHIEKSEEKAGKSKKEAENIAWATANKRGMLNNRNKK